MDPRESVSIADQKLSFPVSHSAQMTYRPTNDVLPLWTFKTEDDHAMTEENAKTGPTFNTVSQIIAILEPMEEKDRMHVLRTVAMWFRINVGTGDSREGFGQPGTNRQSQDNPTLGPSNVAPPFSEREDISPKEFLIQKAPQTDVERVACLAYYLTHLRDTPHFKTQEITVLNTDAAQPQFSNPSQAVDNATKTGYLAPAIKGHKQLSAMGEQFVLALPDREAAKEAMARLRPRRARKRNGGNTENQKEVT